MRVTLEINPAHLPQSLKTPSRGWGVLRANTKKCGTSLGWGSLSASERQTSWWDFNRHIHYLCGDERRGKDGANPAQ